MTKKKIIGLCIGAVVLAVATAGVKEGSWLMKHRRMQNAGFSMRKMTGCT